MDKINKNQMFLGEYQHAIDAKGRLAVPVKFRSMLKNGAVITRGLDSCLFMYPIDEWTKLAQRLASLPISQANTRAFSRLMLAGAMECNVDKQGRVVVPDYLRKYADIGKKVVLAGLYNRLEIWDVESWNEYRSGTEENSGAIAEALHDLGV